MLSGFLFLYISAGCFLGWFLVLNFFLLKPSSLGSLTTLKLMVILDGLLFVGGTVLGALGQLKCSAVPATAGAKGAASAAMVFMILGAVTGFITLALGILLLFGSGALSLLQILPFFLLTAFGSVVGSFILFFFFLTISAVYLQQKGLVSSIMAYVVFLAVSPVAYIAFAATALLLGGPTMGGGGTGPRGRGMGPPPSSGASFGDFVPLIYMMVAAVWFAFILMQLGGAINRARRAASEWTGQ